MIIPYVADEAPEYATKVSAAVDLRASIPTPWRIPPQTMMVVPTGLVVELPTNTVGMVCPRSVLAINHGVTVLNAPGIIDPDYRGEIGVVVINLGTRAYVIEPGARIAQFLVVKAERMKFTKMPSVDALRKTERGDAGFGSTGNG